jgi:hypothetical protein
MRKYEEFKKMWLGKQCRDGQCVALYREYTEGFHDTPMLERLGADGGARLIFEAFNTWVGPVSRSVFEAIPYVQGTTDRPEPGDVVVFGPSDTNRWGHVGIMDQVNGDNINILDQDGIVAMRDGKSVVKVSIWKMTRVLGWLRFKDAEVQMQIDAEEEIAQPPTDAVIAKSDRNAQLGNYWFNQAALKWMLLTDKGWQYI